ncbi:MAG: response regulator transcription factor [Saprospiraceae bacterium]|nr:response regulator transcription factor [Saprospiraceae bacterium]
MDDHQFVIDGLSKMLQTEEGIEIIYTATCGEDLLNFLDTNYGSNLWVDVIMMDISMPLLKMSGLDTAEIIKKRFPAIKILMLTVNDDFDSYQRAKRIGVNGYIPKIKGKKDIIGAIKSAQDGQFIDLLHNR